MGRLDWGNFRRFLLPLLLGALLLALPASGIAAEGETATGAIAGTVSTEGVGVGQVEVCARAVDESSYQCALPLPATGGNYEIPGLTPGDYNVGFWSTGNFVTQFWEDALTWGAAKPISVTAGGITPGIDALLVKGATISGTVTAAATGAPVGEIEACATSGLLERCAKTDGVGSYTIDGLAAGIWNLYFYAQDADTDVVSSAYSGGAIEVSPGDERSNVNAALIPGGQIAGTVRLASTGAPLGGVQVCVTMASSPDPLTCLRTPDSGAYRFTRVWPGAFKVVFSPEPTGTEGPDSYPTQWWGGQSTFAAATAIEITPPAVVSDIDASLVGPPPAPAVTPITPPAPKKPVLKCKRGFVKRKVHGKQRCVKRHRPAQPKPHRHKHHKAKHQPPRSRPKRP
jgi:hypothetical protein